MSTINVNRRVSDSYYRYKMPKIVAKIEGRGNGIKTLIVNLSEIAKSLNRPVMYVLKYIGCEVGALSNADIKSDRYIVNGVHDSDKLQVVMDGFIDRYVLCSGCSNPETDICVYPRREKISLKCNACGTTTSVPTSHKISSFMFKNPPPDSKKSKAKSAKVKKTAEKTEDIAMPEAIKEGGDDDDDLDLPDADSKEVEELTSRVSLLTATSVSHKKTKERLEILEKFIKDKLTQNKDLKVHYDLITTEVKRLALEEKYVFALCSCIFDENIVSQLKIHHSGLSKFVYGNEESEKYFLCWLECLINSHESKLLPLVSTIFKMVYDADIVTEESFFAWNKKRKSRYVSLELLNKIRSSANKFMTWLENAEEESSEEDIDGEAASNDQLKKSEATRAPNQVPQIVEEDDDDLNIDDI